jgi:hypothetical protein
MTPRRELAPRSDGARYRRVTLIVEHDGALSLNQHQMGAGPGSEWGLDDEEVTLTVPPAHVARLALALAAELLRGDAGDLQQLSQICEANDVPCRIACWS